MGEAHAENMVMGSNHLDERLGISNLCTRGGESVRVTADLLSCLGEGGEDFQTMKGWSINRGKKARLSTPHELVEISSLAG